MDRPNVGRKLPRRTGGEEPQARQSIVKYAFVGLSARAGATTLAFAFADWAARQSARGKGTPALSLSLPAKKPKKRNAAGSGRALPAEEPGRSGLAEPSAKLQNGGGVAVVGIDDDELRLGGSDYDRVGIDMRFSGREYLSPYARLAAGASVRGIHNVDGGVNWLLRAPGESCAGFTATDYVRLSSGATEDTVIIDVKGGFGGDRRISELPKLLNDCDRVFAVVDPLPSALMADTEKLELFKSLELGGADILYVINRMNPGVDVREMRSFIKVRRAVEIPFFPPEHIYAAEYNCCTLYAMPKATSLLTTAFEQMAL
ncbi:MAG: hypothetical protein LBS67_01990 [Clostridiales Family XIII bacterium]|jgi:hypothetical protein|nr:hypothetical protein [Clostridiales Family XIII bacterium]